MKDAHARVAPQMKFEFFVLRLDENVLEQNALVGVQVLAHGFVRLELIHRVHKAAVLARDVCRDALEQLRRVVQQLFLALRQQRVVGLRVMQVLMSLLSRLSAGLARSSFNNYQQFYLQFICLAIHVDPLLVRPTISSPLSLPFLSAMTSALARRPRRFAFNSKCL